MVSKASCLACMKTNLLLLLTIAGVIVGICFGIGMRALDPPLSNLDIGLLMTFFTIDKPSREDQENENKDEIFDFRGENCASDTFVITKLRIFKIPWDHASTRSKDGCLTSHYFLNYFRNSRS